jgi:1,4-alpha-glucan branching enzyme
MVNKEFTPKKTVCKVTFKVPADWAANEIALVGDFNEWDAKANSLTMKNGSWETTLRLAPSAEYKFRYFIDGERWENDDQADAYVTNEFGTEDSVLIIEA